jgi:L-asparagine transporter-like permease
MSLLLPGKVYEYITTAAGLMLLYNWCFILLSSGKLLKSSTSSNIKRWVGLLLIAMAVVGSFFHKLSRPGVYISLLLVLFIAICDLIVQWVRRKHAKESR